MLRGKGSRSGYKNISEDVREQLVNRVLNQGEGLKEVSAALNVNISTSKAILKVFTQEGRIGKKKRRNKVVDVLETFTFFDQTGDHFQQIGAPIIQSYRLSYERHENLDKKIEDCAKVKGERLINEVLDQRNRERQRERQMASQLEGTRYCYDYINFLTPILMNNLAYFYPQGFNLKQ